MAMPAFDEDLFGVQEPRICSIPPHHSGAAGRECIEFCESVGFEFDPWQSWMLRESLGTRANGTWAAKEVAEVLSRQNGKNLTVEAREIYGLFELSEPLIIHTAHEFKASNEHFLRLKDRIHNSDELSRRIKSIITSHGEEAVLLRPAPALIFGSRAKLVRKTVAPRLRFLARSRGSGRSFTCNCFSGDTRYWTREGLKTLAETVGTVQEVLVNAGPGYGGAWRKAEIRSFGQQPLWAVTLRRNKVTKVIRATEGHRWLVRDTRIDKPPRVLTTGELHAGHRLEWRLPKSWLKDSTPSPFGIAHGITFGDGSRTRWGSEVRLFGEKDAQLLRYFPESRTTPIASAGGVSGLHVAHLPLFFKDRPPLDESVPYLYGWLAGYFAADGCVTKDGMAALASASRENLEFVQLLAARLGISTYGIRGSVKTTGYGTGGHYEIQFIGSTLRPDFFLIAEHRERYAAAHASPHRTGRWLAGQRRAERFGWTVVSAEPTGETEEVFCAVVPEYENFVLEDWINVKNCLVWDEAMILTTDQVGASMPTMSAVPNPQLWYLASAGYPDSTQLASVRRRGIRGDDDRLAYFEWSIRPHNEMCPRDERIGRRSNEFIVCREHDDRDDPLSWAKANPALGYRITPEHVAWELSSMPADAFNVERLGAGHWPTDEEGWLAVTEDQWNACETQILGGTATPVVFAVDITPDLTAACISAAWQRPSDGIIIVEQPSDCFRPGTSWVVPKLIELRRKWKPLGIAIPKTAPASALMDDAENRGIELMKATASEEAQAFTLMITAIRDKQIGQLGPDEAPYLRSAVARAETRDMGDGMRGWSRKNSASNITALTSATLAHWAYNRLRRGYNPLRSIG